MTLDELLWKPEDIGAALSELQKPFSSSGLDEKELQKPFLPSGLGYDDLIVAYFHLLNGQKISQINVTEVAKALKEDPADVKKAFDRYVALRLMKDVGDGKYEIDQVTRTGVKRMSHAVLSSLLDSPVKSRYLIFNLPDAFARMREYARKHIYVQPPTSSQQTKS
ncbi:hypothetical protein HYX05_04250 [Candidatus Woesearchaeota archaeon]|nr:hypothetical protein [Candidatus Woesearchaeota archaeon]